MNIETYVEVLEKNILSHGFNVPYQQNLTREEQPALQNVCGYDHDIIIKQEDKESAVDGIDRDVYVEKARRQLSDSNVYIWGHQIQKLGSAIRTRMAPAYA